LKFSLVHEYLKVEVDELSQNFQKAFGLFPAFSEQIEEWVEKAGQ